MAPAEARHQTATAFAAQSKRVCSTRSENETMGTGPVLRDTGSRVMIPVYSKLGSKLGLYVMKQMRQIRNESGQNLIYYTPGYKPTLAIGCLEYLTTKAFRRCDRGSKI
jgi:hypothetical protein